MTQEAITLQITEPNLPPSILSSLEQGFKASFEQAEKWRIQALAIKVTSLDQKAEMKLARTIRLELKNIRVAAEKTRKNLKEDSLRMGKAIDGVNNLLLAAIVPLERHLEEQEQYGERLAEAERQRIKAERESAISPFIEAGQAIPQLDIMSEDQWTAFLADAKLLHEAKLETARKAEVERIAREQAEAAERERLRIENERLRQEAAEREAKAKTEREAAERAQREAAEKARKEREAIEAKAKAEREAAERELARIKAEADKVAAAERTARAQAEAELAAKKAAEEAAEKAAAAAAAKAARAPDKTKIKAFAASIRAIKAPEASTADGKKVATDIAAKIEGFAKWIEAQAETL